MEFKEIITGKAVLACFSYPALAGACGAAGSIEPRWINRQSSPELPGPFKMLRSQSLGFCRHSMVNSSTSKSSKFEPDRGKGLGLSFSGGGYRAAAFSLGTIALLEDLQLMQNAHVLSGVSGGSLAVGAYVCGKAGSIARDVQYNFYQAVYEPLLESLCNEQLAMAFIRPVRLLMGEKILSMAANKTQELLTHMLQEEATFNSRHIASMLAKDGDSPDYVFFNTTNIRSLDLFRFGIQRDDSAQLSSAADTAAAQNKAVDPPQPTTTTTTPLLASGNPRESQAHTAGNRDGSLVAPVYVLNRYFIKSRTSCSRLYKFSGWLRLADCIAASYAFPGGFEPLIFPNDFFSYLEKGDGVRDVEQACQEFRGSVLCDNKPYLAFLDGGLYDNLGLASVEDIRNLLDRKSGHADFVVKNKHCDQSESPPSSVQAPGADASEKLARAKRVKYVIATDADNIQPSICSYHEPGLDPATGLPVQPQGPAPQSVVARKGLMSQVQDWTHGIMRVLRSPLSFIIPFGLGVWLASMGLTLPMVGVQWMPSKLLFVAFLLVLVLMLLVLAPLARSISRLIALVSALVKESKASLGRPGASALKSNLNRPTWLQNLGISQSSSLSSKTYRLGSIAYAFLQESLQAKDLAYGVGQVKQAIVGRRLGQLLPAFNGYLKRTRSLTYCYLENHYRQSVALPLGDAGSDNAGSGTAGQREHCCKASCEASTDRPYLIRNMIFELNSGPDVDPDDLAQHVTLPVQDFETAFSASTDAQSAVKKKMQTASRMAMQLANTGHATMTHPEALKQAIADLNIPAAASIWFWLDCQLARAQDDLPESDASRGQPQSGPPLQQGSQGHAEEGRSKHPSSTSEQDHSSSSAVPDAAIQKLTREVRACLVGAQRGVSPDLAPGDSWIPLICEMATNLNTTLWISGYRWYVPNRLAHGEIIDVGGWYSYDPRPKFGSKRQVLDLGSDEMAARITVLCGYINMTFNLLEFADSLVPKNCQCRSAAEESRGSGRSDLDQESPAGQG